MTDERPVLVIAHRGASADAPENTVEAFRLAAAQGADWVELDVRRAADGALVVLHDAVLPDGRTVVEWERSALPASVPSLPAALDACAGMGVNIEIKNSVDDPDHDPSDSVADLVVALLAERGGHDEVLISSFADHTIARVRERAPHLGTAYLVETDISEAIDVAVNGGHQAIHPWDPIVTAELVATARQAGLEVNVYTVDEPARMRDLARMGVTGIVTNVPAVALRALR
jgi:glycerophosphoryl diester phosphodiesterase